MSGFRDRSAQALADPVLRQAMKNASGKFVEKREEIWAELPDVQALRLRAAWCRRRAITRLREMWERFAETAEQAGVTIHWAGDAEEARSVIVGLCRRLGGPLVAKSKSMMTEEIELNPALEKAGIEVVETDLGELIIQWAKEPPSHIIAPAVHKTREQVRDLLVEHTGDDAGDDINAMADIARRYLRKVFLTADIGITGGNLAIAETGSVVLVTNEGNGRMIATLPRVVISVIGAEKIVAEMGDAATVLELLARSATGQKASSYVQWLTGPRRGAETDGPDELHVVVVDSGRSEIAIGGQWEVLSCIRCGSCLNVCPVYSTTGGHAYNSPYQGPIGAVITPLLRGEAGDWELPQASTLCGACLDACPVMIDLPQMLLDLRSLPIKPLAGRLSGRAGSLLARPGAFRGFFRLLRLLQRPFVADERIRWAPGPLRRWLDTRTLRSLASRFFQERD